MIISVIPVNTFILIPQQYILVICAICFQIILSLIFGKYTFKNMIAYMFSSTLLLFIAFKVIEIIININSTAYCWAL